MSHVDDVSRSAPVASVSLNATLEAQLLIVQAQLRAAEADARAARQLFTDAPHAAFLLTADGCIVDANAQAYALLSADAPTLTRRRLGQWLSPASQPTLTALLKGVFAGPASQGAELTLVTSDGALQAVMVRVRVCPAPGAAPTCQLVMTDVTALKEANRALLDEAEGLRAQLASHEARHRRLDDEVREVVGATQVQLQLQLARVQTGLNLHCRSLPAAAQRCPHLHLTRDALGATFGLLGCLTQYVQARQLRVRLRSVDLNQVLADVMKDLQPRLKGREVQVTAGDLPTVLGDSRALQLILGEYLGNALKFTRTRDAANVRVLVEDTAQAYLIGVQDNGVGFHMRHRDRAFDLFARLHPAGAYEGAGLGLAVVRRLCERLGGRAWAEGKVGHGATFWFACPKVPALTL
ncbi:sensor histidine kinase (plasmid) [Deinococcus taeanensis]|uniref:sensor histidine kinase n=1 Tax=Deinococcus taeanensis TaxID=2737050 RepID=UPI001CDD3A01|nr:sensor histidine kinase [Deinococcus taeanensis]UBV44285.1 sensor histidine kinase [Deinococcus taeanensis]